LTAELMSELSAAMSESLFVAAHCSSCVLPACPPDHWLFPCLVCVDELRFAGSIGEPQWFAHSPISCGMLQILTPRARRSSTAAAARTYWTQVHASRDLCLAYFSSLSRWQIARASRCWQCSIQNLDHSSRYCWLFSLPVALQTSTASRCLCARTRP
jgi:hypothetical protein